jgi:uncharacterized protein DUF2795
MHAGSVEEVHSAASPIDVQKFLSGVDYPTDKATLVEHATSQGADDDIRSRRWRTSPWRSSTRPTT